MLYDFIQIIWEELTLILVSEIKDVLFSYNSPLVLLPNHVPEHAWLWSN